MKYSKYDVVIIGSGISGLFLANKLSEEKNIEDGILLVTKDKLFSGSSALAQGGIVSVIPEINQQDSIESHIKDTMKAGCGLNNINTVRFVSENSAFAAQELMRYGVTFDRNEKNLLNFTLEGAHSCPRILHSEGDSTGRVIESALCKRLSETQNVDIYEKTIVSELLIDSNDECKGVVVFNHENRTFEAIYSSNIVIATGGIGQIYKTTTNPEVSTGDGIALAYRGGAEVENMEFVQFHPTGLYCKGKNSVPLVSESVRGEGGKLVDLDGEYFAKQYHHLADLAPRDVVSRAIVEQKKDKKSEYVNLDISQIGIEQFKRRFPTITSLCQENDVDLSDGLIPVSPVEHYFMGGIKVDINSKTNIKNLYAIGECASTGLHGANRLASNSLLECVVFAQSLASELSKNSVRPPKKNDLKIKATIDKYSNIDFSDYDTTIIKKIFSELKETMTNKVGISRDAKSLSSAINDINMFSAKLNDMHFGFSLEKYELENALLVAKLVAFSALSRENSIGAHFREDFRETQTINNEGTISNDTILA